MIFVLCPALTLAFHAMGLELGMALWARVP